MLSWLIAMVFCFRDWRDNYLLTKPAVMALLVFGWLLLACAWSPVPFTTSWSSLSKYVDLVLIPVFAWAGASFAARRHALIFFTIAIVLTLAVSYGSALSLWHSLPGLRTFPHYPIGFRLSITHNLLVSAAAFVFLLLARDLRSVNRPGAYAFFALALVCIHNVLFIVTGRTGYVVLTALLVYFAGTVVGDRRSMLVAALVLTALLGSAYFGSQRFPASVIDVASEMTRWQRGTDDETSVGRRMSFYDTTLEIIREHPLGGIGTGNFAQAFADKVRGTSSPETMNPHNDYLMIAVQAGLPGVVLLIALYAALWREAQRLRSPLERDLLRGLVLMMAIAGAFNSVLMDHAEGLLFAWAAGALCSTRRADRDGHGA